LLGDAVGDFRPDLGVDGRAAGVEQPYREHVAGRDTRLRDRRPNGVNGRVGDLPDQFW
jgi:hypothetical protein